MPGDRLLVVSDAHLGAVPPALEDRLLAFLGQAPSLGDALLINGDLFDFFFAYRRALPRRALPVLAVLRDLARRIPVVMTGGNHDRWGDSFWERDLGIRFSPGELRFEVAGRQVLAIHGDGFLDEAWSARLLHRVTRHPASIATFRALPPDLGFWIADRLSGRLGDDTRDTEALERAAARQRAWAEDRLARDPGVSLLVMGHTHRPAVSEPQPGRRYLNPGAWFDGRRYALVTGHGIELRQYPE